MFPMLEKFRKKKEVPKEKYKGMFDEHTKDLLIILIRWAGYKRNLWKFAGELTLDDGKYTYSLHMFAGKIVFEMRSSDEQLQLVGNEHDREFFEPYFVKKNHEYDERERKTNEQVNRGGMMRIKELTEGIVDQYKNMGTNTDDTA